jgi:glycosyltransferase involved in cell wall biosynthesis
MTPEERHRLRKERAESRDPWRKPLSGANPKISAVCVTFNRPQILGRLIKCFERQDYENRELIVLDDLGMYENQSGNKWQLISIPQRFRTLGEKRNAAAGLTSKDSVAYAVWDDDDFYYPWALSAIVEALSRSPIVQPNHAIDFDLKSERFVGETFCRRSPEYHAYHGCWGYTRSLFEHFNGYPQVNCGEDQILERTMKGSGLKAADIATKPFYVYNRVFQGYRISELGVGDGPPDKMAEGSQWVGKIPEWTCNKDWESPIPEGIRQRGW